MKVAFVHDYLNQYGGAERVLEAFCELWPEAPIYTLLYDKKKLAGIFGQRRIYTSFLQKIPLVTGHHRPFLFLMPMAIEQLNLLGYDLVISDSASYAKGVITRPDALHICYCHTPTRYIWDDCHKYARDFYYPSWVKRVIPFFLNYLRLWDEAAAGRVDKFIANSQFIAGRIKKYYRREAEVIYPPARLDLFRPAAAEMGDYFLAVGRFLPYKKLDLVIEAFNQLGLSLVIVGDGPKAERNRLKNLARRNIKFVGWADDAALNGYYQHCRALIFPQEEDFGIAAVEAMACGRPVIAYKKGGALETVKEGETGIFFEEPTMDSLMAAVKKFEKMAHLFQPVFIRRHSEQFDKEIFKIKIKNFAEKSWQEFKANL